MLRLEPDRASVAHARHWVLRRAAEAGVAGEPGAVVELLTSELVANAVVHGPPQGSILVRTSARDGWFEVSVSDESLQAPVVRDSGPLDEGGRGMMLVELMAADWGVRTDDGMGKSVWFQVAF
jgi:anti-sigma regulatory factor (Ser/Thr protein kinase)